MIERKNMERVEWVSEWKSMHPLSIETAIACWLSFSSSVCSSVNEWFNVPFGSFLIVVVVVGAHNDAIVMEFPNNAAKRMYPKKPMDVLVKRKVWWVCLCSRIIVCLWQTIIPINVCVGRRIARSMATNRNDVDKAAASGILRCD